MIDTLLIDCEQPESGVGDMIRRPDLGPRIMAIGMYDFDDMRLGDYRALLIGMHCDQLYLSRRRERIEAFVRAGGTLVVSGHVAWPVVSGLTAFQPIPDYRLADLQVQRESAHPVWDGVAMDDLTFRRGVAGFYGRGWHVPPPDATVIHSLGPERRPLDFAYALGAGRVLFHGGNDLWTYLDTGNSAERMVPQLFDWIAS
jgi:hypothetical protein